MHVPLVQEIVGLCRKKPVKPSPPTAAASPGSTSRKPRGEALAPKLSSSIRFRSILPKIEYVSIGKAEIVAMHSLD